MKAMKRSSAQTVLKFCMATGLGLLTVLAADQAFAAGFYLPGRGVRPISRAGAYVTSGHKNLNSMWYNPANASGFEDFTLTIDAALISLSMEHQRAPRIMDDGTQRTYPAVHSDAPPQPIPQILLGGPTPYDDIYWSFGAYTPYMSPARFPETGPQRYVLVDNQGSLMGIIQAGLAWEINDRVRVGASLQNFMANYRVISTTSGYAGLFGDPEDPDLDTLIEVTTRDLFSISANFGAWFSLTPWLEASASLQLPSTIHDTDATAKVRMADHPAYDNAALDGDTMTIIMKLPLIARTGVRYVADKYDVEFAITYERWSTMDKIIASPNDASISGTPGLGAVTLQPFIIPQEMNDTFAFHLGGQYQLRPRFAVRAGYAFEMSAIPDNRISVFFVDGNKHLFGLGATYQFDAFELDLSLAYYNIANHNITNSDVRQINQSDFDGELTLIVGNGTYDASLLLFGVAVNF